MYADILSGLDRRKICISNFCSVESKDSDDRRSCPLILAITVFTTAVALVVPAQPCISICYLKVGFVAVLFLRISPFFAMLGCNF